MSVYHMGVFVTGSPVPLSRHIRIHIHPLPCLKNHLIIKPTSVDVRVDAGRGDRGLGLSQGRRGGRGAGTGAGPV